MNQEQIYELMEKLEASQLAELKIETEAFKITLKKPRADRGRHMPVPSAPGQSPVPIAQEPVHAAEGIRAPKDTEIIQSPIIGTFYRAPATDAPVFVDEGSTVSAGNPLCIIEAMKIMNKLEAEFPCEIVKVLAENGQMVEYNTPLFEVKRV